MATVTMKELLEAGVHFGHQVRRWNPKMKEYIFGERNGIYIIDLQKTQKLFRDALAFVQDTVTEKPNTKVLFVGTKRQAQDAIVEEAERCNQFYINNRWLGGLMTNYKTVQKSIMRLKEIEQMREDGRAEMLTKKERLQLERELAKLMKNLSGIKDMGGLPDLLFVIDVRKEDIAIKEANRLDIPVIAVVDTNCSPEGIDYVVPGNDDALRAIRLFTSRVADAILEGQNLATEGMTEMTEDTVATVETEGESSTTESTDKNAKAKDEKAGEAAVAVTTKKSSDKEAAVEVKAEDAKPETKTAAKVPESAKAETKQETKAGAKEETKTKGEASKKDEKKVEEEASNEEKTEASAS